MLCTSRPAPSLHRVSSMARLPLASLLFPPESSDYEGLSEDVGRARAIETLKRRRTESQTKPKTLLSPPKALRSPPPPFPGLPSAVGTYEKQLKNETSSLADACSLVHSCPHEPVPERRLPRLPARRQEALDVGTAAQCEHALLQDAPVFQLQGGDRQHLGNENSSERSPSQDPDSSRF